MFDPGRPIGVRVQDNGRWPSNIVFIHPNCSGVCNPDCPIAELDRQSGITQSGAMRHEVPAYEGESTIGFLRGFSGPSNQHGGSGGASRFFKQSQIQKDAMSQPLPQDLLDYFSTMISPPGRTAFYIPDVGVESIWTAIANMDDASLGAVIAVGTPTEEQSKELMRVLLPGAHLILVAPEEETTGHTGACRIEDAGFEIRDAILLADQAEGIHYVPKAGRREREAGCDALEGKTGADATDRKEGTAGLDSPRAGAGRTAVHVRNFHPTVKPLQLMQRLIRDIPQGGGAILDPFVGSGTTVVAAILEGHSAIGIEREEDYLKIADARARGIIGSRKTPMHLRQRDIVIESDAEPPPRAPKELSFEDVFGFEDEDEG